MTKLTRSLRNVALAMTLSAGACAQDPVGPVNHHPVINSVTVFPTQIGPSDSALVIVAASDPDLDSLVYDWETDSRLRIKDAYPGDNFLYNTSEPSRIFYYGPTAPGKVSAWVKCYVRDRRGGVDGRLVYILVSDQATRNPK